VLLLLVVLFLAYNAVSFPAKKTTFFLKDENISTLLHILDEKGYHTYSIDGYVLKLMPKVKKGWYQLEANKLGRFHFFKTLHSKNIPSMNIKIYAGETTAELIERLANDMKLQSNALLKYYKKRSLYKEANIFSGHYNVPRNADENMTINILFDVSNKIFKDFETNFCHKKITPLNMKIFVTVASIIQKESNNKKEMPLISSVIYNRVLKGMKLQMDGTLNYDKYSHTIVTADRIKNDTSAYNTYKYKGIPPHPLSTISIEALQAAYNPAKTEYLFFMLNKDGSHNFSKTYKEHLENVRSFKKKSKEKKNLNETNSSKQIKVFL
jgi:UPF0755 protein